MKLRGSRQEKDFRVLLIKNNEKIRNPENPLNKILKKHGHNPDHAYVISHVPDQTSDFYQLLISGEYILAFEVDRISSTIENEIERIELSSYQKGLSKINQVQLAVAKDLLDNS